MTANKDRDMKNVTELMSPATIAALLLIAASASTPPAMAEGHLLRAASTAPSAPIRAASREQAKKAHEDAVEDAARAIRADARLDLDIHLNRRTPTLVVRES
jgi:hypothetical protein